MSVLTELRIAGEWREQARKRGQLKMVPPSLQVRMDAEAGTDVFSPTYPDHFDDSAYREEVENVIAELRGVNQVRKVVVVG